MVVQFGDESRRSPRLADLAARCGGRYAVVATDGREADEDGADVEDQLGR
jgi:hypothetical protein